MVAKDGTGVITADISKLTAANGFDASNGLTGEGSASAGEVTLKKAGNPLESLDKALQAVDTQRSQLGAIQNRFESAITNLSTNETNLSAARSRIEDADYATEVANMTKNQILQQAGTSVLAQANQLPQSVLSLLG
jgi:flagellin